MGRKISIRRKRCVREEDSETNNRVIDTVVRPNKEVSIIVILMNRLVVSFIIRALNNENPLSCQRVCVACIFEKKKIDHVSLFI